MFLKIFENIESTFKHIFVKRTVFGSLRLKMTGI